VGTDLRVASKRVGNEPFEFWLRNRVTPDGTEIRFIEGDIDGRRVVMMSVEAASGVQARFERNAYIRVGSATPPLADHPDRELRLTQVLVQETFEDGYAAIGLTALDVRSLLDVEGAFALLREQMPSRDDEIASQLERSGRTGRTRRSRSRT
jgi:ATP-dependent DNA helicase RecG